MNIEQRIKRLEEKVSGKNPLKESEMFPTIFRKIEDALDELNSLENLVRRERDLLRAHPNLPLSKIDESRNSLYTLKKILYNFENNK